MVGLCVSDESSSRLYERVKRARASRLRGRQECSLRELALCELMAANGLLSECESITGPEARFARKALGLTREQVEQLLGLPTGVLEQIEAGSDVPPELHRALLLAGVAVALHDIKSGGCQ